jgi:hypothetical protein
MDQELATRTAAGTTGTFWTSTAEGRPTTARMPTTVETITADSNKDVRIQKQYVANNS